MTEHEHWMRIALQEASLAGIANEVPVGAVVVRNGVLLAQAGNRRIRDADPTAHAEILVLRAVAAVLGDWRLNECTLYVTLEPCPMCAGAILLARLATVWYGASDPHMGCCGSVYSIPEDPAWGASTTVNGGLLAVECAALLNAFFVSKREENR